ncbi:MAG: arsenate reductase (glutaredoxin) [Halobacteriovoraceae bacterium]|jgi:arsenate reductase (glutaredoxin)|nr:arsenate reductase (glutaredoxin) [Halobacteriovoraceae bacterium]MBT5094886.1 arsenate reductase (glutaredoxin) [Halobacteriovoraceae bacterium]
MSYTYYHNPRCSKSRQGLALLEERELDFEVVLYLQNPPTVETLLGLFSRLEKEPLEVIRTKESCFKELGLDHKMLSDEEWAGEIAKNPVLLERPILDNGQKAAIGRPPEDLLALL